MRSLIFSPLEGSHPSKLDSFKGRHAIYEALRRLGIGQGDEVIVQAFTCVAVIRPILDLGATPIYVDVKSKTLNPSFDQIKKPSPLKLKP